MCCIISSNVLPFFTVTGLISQNKMANKGGSTMDNAQAKLWAQVEAIKGIPCKILLNWPAFLSFGLIDWAATAIIRGVPGMTGVSGEILDIALNGFRDTTKFVTWEAVKSSGVCAV